MSLLSEDRVPFRLPPMGGVDDTDLFSFQGSVGPHGENRREDVIKAQMLLAQTGDYKSPFDVPTGWPSNDLYQSIKAFQKRHGKQPDGTLLPLPPGGVDENGVGESLNALRGELGEQLAGQKAPTPSQIDARFETQSRFRNTVAREEAQPQSAPRNGEQLTQASGAGDHAGPESGRAEPVRRSQTEPMPLPDFKKSYFAQPANKGAWDQSQSALLRQLPNSPVLRGALGRIYAEEGGRIRDPRDTAVGGLTAGTLRELQEKGLLPDLPQNATPQSLTPDQQIAAYRAYLDQTMRHIGGVKALENLDPDFAHAIADAVFMDGSKGGMRFVQEAIRQTGVEPGIELDGGMGPRTFEALRRANDDPVARAALQDKIAALRINGRNRTQSEIERISRTRPGAWKH